MAAAVAPTAGGQEGINQDGANQDGTNQEDAGPNGRTAGRTDEEPAWYHYERGMMLLRERAYDRALQQFRAAIAKGNPYPEAQAGIGRVFQAEGSYDLAERQYREALSRRAAFRNPDYAYEIRYRLAELYGLRNRHKEYEDALRAITAEDPFFSDDQYTRLRASYRSTLLSDGLDRLVTLYRQERGFALRAHRELGIFYVKSGRYNEALDHLIFAALKSFTTLVSEMRSQVFEYEFVGARELLTEAMQFEQMAEYVTYTSLHEILYYLAAAVYGTEPSSPAWQEVWGMLAGLDSAEEWQGRARSQLRNPELEPLLEYQLGARKIWTALSSRAHDSITSRTSMWSFHATGSSWFRG